MKTVAIIPAGGSGKRMRGSLSKQYLSLEGKPILAHTLNVFEHSPDIDEIVLVTPGTDMQMVRQMIIEPYRISKVSHVLAGGEQRQDSVGNGLAVIGNDVEIVLIHDAVRPFVSTDLIRRTVLEAGKYGAVTVGTPVKDTVKKVDQNGGVLKTLDRRPLWLTQTPQAFQRSVIQEAYRRAQENRFYGTDDASLVERMGFRVKMLAAFDQNIKITTPEDLLLAEFLIKRQKKGDCLVRIGFGYDSHRLVEGRRLVLGGIEIPHDRGLSGHSDADVLIHAICDAILGALAAGDIGRHFPDADAVYKDISSLKLLESVRTIGEQRGYGVHNIDTTVVLEKPKISEYIRAMSLKLAEALKIPEENVSIKAKTNEGMGFAGRQEGVAAYAVVTMTKKGDE
ncbi:MAG: bifunctional 2-C-methyl-D-erythritol 4-phosphate cytidylyltransferase/2-C-methyl-D-erythritol 2,4-cyclodiphosphate synthase [Syntrophus sp. (in: bacteria)]|nr:bifunctional 2-C-methyl-D-erythritol 4-phosphate cytidylyltransferase/2-C-methyl-D-erythritol 2,4-cyclodiphosphate synthase [Syntrophus sp. (in: bacteria)]